MLNEQVWAALSDDVASAEFYSNEDLTLTEEFILGPRTPQDVFAFLSADLIPCAALQQHFDEDR